jgi:DNA polymerase
MTAEEKIALAGALDMAEDYLRDGYVRDRGDYVFAEDPPESDAAPVQAAADSLGACGAKPRSLLEALAADIRSCAACPLHTTREKAVGGDGAAGPLVLILGDAPGKEDEEAGKPFAGSAGELLDRMLRPIALSRRTNCYLSNLVKCRVPEDGRPPSPEEIAACAPFLKRELALLKPLAILRLAQTPGLNETPGSKETDGSAERTFDLLEASGIPLFSTCHPALIQSDERLKRPAWEQLKTLSSTLTGLDRDYAHALRSAGKG